MKLSAKKKSEIYDLVHEEIMQARLRIQREKPNENKVDYIVAQLEIPIAQKIFALLDPEYNSIQ